MNSKLKAARKAANKSQEAAAREVAISLSHYQNIEYGKNIPRVDTAIRIARAFGSTVEELFGEV